MIHSMIALLKLKVDEADSKQFYFLFFVLFIVEIEIMHCLKINKIAMKEIFFWSVLSLST